MNDATKTMTFVGIAAVVLALAWVSRPAPLTGPEDDTGEPFFAEFEDPLAATSLEIAEFDEDSASPTVFRVAKSPKGVWSIPSKLDYPADAEEHLADAAASVMDLEKLGVVSDRPADHELFGVVDPSKADTAVEGIGKKVTLENSTGSKLAELIIGKEVADQPGLRYVRLPTRDRVYRTKIDTSNLTTRFQDWIEEDLLELNTLDITDIDYDNYSVQETQQGYALVPRDKLELHYDQDMSKWELTALKPEEATSEWELVEMKPNEELNTERINEVKQALGDLKIVDVQRKPAGLSRELRAEGGNLDAEAQRSLLSRGFLLSKGRLYSNDGEVLVNLKDGVQYILRFGDIAVGTETDEGEESEAGGEEPAGPKGSNRYVFIMAYFNQDEIPAPELEAEPAGPEAAEKPSGDDENAESTEGDAESEPAAEGEEEEVDPEVKRIREANALKQKEYDEKVEEAKKRVAELNDRFADWYYVISDEVYRKIKVDREEIVQPKEGTAGETTEEMTVEEEHPLSPGPDGLDDFEEIKEQIQQTP